MLENQRIPGNLVGCVQVDASRLPFEIDDAEVGGVRELHDGKRAAGGGMGSSSEREHLEVDVGLVAADLDEMCELSAHDRSATDKLAQGAFTQNGPELERAVIAGEHLLPG